MTNSEAIKLFSQLIESNMAGGNIKNFATLDKLREAVKTLEETTSTYDAMKELATKQ